MFRTSNCASSGGVLYKQLTVFHTVNSGIQLEIFPFKWVLIKVKSRILVDTPRKNCATNCKYISAHLNANICSCFPLLIWSNTVTCLYRPPEDKQLFVRNMSRIFSYNKTNEKHLFFNLIFSIPKFSTRIYIK